MEKCPAVDQEEKVDKRNERDVIRLLRQVETLKKSQRAHVDHVRELEQRLAAIQKELELAHQKLAQVHSDADYIQVGESEITSTRQDRSVHGALQRRPTHRDEMIHME